MDMVVENLSKFFSIFTIVLVLYTKYFTIQDCSRFLQIRSQTRQLLTASGVNLIMHAFIHVNIHMIQHFHYILIGVVC